MSRFASYDGTVLAYRILGSGEPLICLPEIAAEAVRLFTQGKLIVQPGAGHMPWLDDPAYFAGAIDGFLG